MEVEFLYALQRKQCNFIWLLAGEQKDHTDGNQWGWVHNTHQQRVCFRLYMFSPARSINGYERGAYSICYLANFPDSRSAVLRDLDANQFASCMLTKCNCVNCRLITLEPKPKIGGPSCLRKKCLLQSTFQQARCRNTFGLLSWLTSTARNELVVGELTLSYRANYRGATMCLRHLWGLIEWWKTIIRARQGTRS